MHRKIKHVRYYVLFNGEKDATTIKKSGERVNEAEEQQCLHNTNLGCFKLNF